MAMVDRELWEQAVAARENAYAPYSHFRVGAALRAADGTIITGANVENASYPLSCCAERTAVYTAAAHGLRDFVRMVVVGPGPELISPCGGCRQVLAEFGDFEVVMADAAGQVQPRVMRVAELLPAAFSKEDLRGL
jgi:cytidine deaminase